MQVRELGHEGASLALRAPLIQRKRAHSFSTAAAIALALIATAGCAGRETAATPSGDAGLRPELIPIRVRPGQADFARVVMTNGGVRVGSASVTFSINEPPLVPGTAEPGAALAAATAMTDASGVATIGVSVDERVGLASTFSIHATAGIAHTDVTVVVADENSGSVEIVPFFPNPETSVRATGGIILRLVDRQRCADLDPYRPPDVAPARLTAPMAPGDTARFEYVTTTRPAAALGRANNEHGELIALGCIDLPEG